MTFQTIGNILSYSSVCVCVSVFFFASSFLGFCQWIRLHTFFRPVFFPVSFFPRRLNPEQRFSVRAGAFFTISRIVRFFATLTHSIGDGFLQRKEKMTTTKTANELKNQNKALHFLRRFSFVFWILFPSRFLIAFESLRR